MQRKVISANCFTIKLKQPNKYFPFYLRNFFPIAFFERKIRLHRAIKLFDEYGHFFTTHYKSAEYMNKLQQKAEKKLLILQKLYPEITDTYDYLIAFYGRVAKNKSRLLEILNLAEKHIVDYLFFKLKGVTYKYYLNDRQAAEKYFQLANQLTPLNLKLFRED